jgi:outer membrane protein
VQVDLGRSCLSVFEEVSRLVASVQRFGGASKLRQCSAAPLARNAGLVAFMTLAAGMLAAGGAQAESISGALARAYGSSPDLNAQRALARSIDENVPKATSGYRPTVTATGNIGYQENRSRNTARNIATNGAGTIITRGANSFASTIPGAFGLSVTQNIWNGNRTINGVRQADSQVLQAREQLRQNEQTLLANAAAAYMNVLRDTAILNLRNNNVDVLKEQLRLTQDRFKVGEVTRTDTAQAESALAKGQSDAFVAQSNLQTSLAAYRQFIGVDAKSLDPARPLEKLSPRNLNDALMLSQTEHPAIQAALHNVDVASLAVKLNEGTLYPTLGVTGSILRSYDANNAPGTRVINASIIGQLNVPIYDGGANYATIRQSKELLGQARLQADLQRDIIRAGVVSAWGLWENSRRVIDAQQVAVRAAEIALNGVREEAKVGQRTTVEVLNQQQLLLQTRVDLVSAQRDRVVNSYALVSAIGRLSASTLGLRVDRYDPTIHYDQVKDKWIGLKTPDGR